MDETRTKLEERINSLLDKMSSLDPSSKEYADAANALNTLYRLSMDETEKERAFVRNCDRDVIETRELELKVAQLEDQRKGRWLTLALESAGLVLPLIFYGVWMRRGFKFEQEGTFTSTTFRGLFSKFKPTKK